LSEPIRTPLFQVEKELGASFQDFHGWITPLRFSGITREALAVRNGAGVFDVSHMGRLIVSRSEAKKYASLFTNNVEGTKPGRMKYSYVLDADGFVIDDVVSYGLESRLLLVVNTWAKEQDLRLLAGVAEVSDITEHTSMIAVQGPASEAIARSLGLDLGGWFSFSERGELLVSRSGYTGEDGFEVIGPPEQVERVYGRAVEMGAIPCGLGARDVLRLEAGYTLSGVDTDRTTTPLDVGGGAFIKWDRDFVGKEALLGRPEKKLFGFIAEEGIPRSGCTSDFGVISSGTFSPTLRKGIGLVRPKGEVPTPGTDLSFSCGERYLSGKASALPFVPWRYPR